MLIVGHCRQPPSTATDNRPPEIVEINIYTILIAGSTLLYRDNKQKKLC